MGKIFTLRFRCFLLRFFQLTAYCYFLLYFCGICKLSFTAISMKMIESVDVHSANKLPQKRLRGSVARFLTGGTGDESYCEYMR